LGEVQRLRDRNEPPHGHCKPTNKMAEELGRLGRCKALYPERRTFEKGM
jgi:hypothetical protein